MKDTYYVLAKVVWCGECDDFAIEEIIRFKHNVPFESKEIAYYINKHYIHDDEDKSIADYVEGGRLYYYVHDIGYDFDPEFDGLSDAMALYTIYRYQQTEATVDYDRTPNDGGQNKSKRWQICWKRAWYEDEKFSWFYAKDAAIAKEMLKNSLPETPIIIWIQEG